MADTDEPQMPWLDNWLEAQREFWQPFLAGQSPPTPPPLASAMPFLHPAAALPDSPAEVSRRMLAFGESYLGVAREFWKALDPAGTAGAPADLERRLGALRDSFTQGFARLYGTAAAGDTLATWQRLAGMTPPAGKASAGFPFPAIGPAREQHEAGEKALAAWNRYQSAMARFGEVLGRVSSDAVERLTRRLTRRAGEAAPPDSLRALYQLWVDCGEEAYAAAAHAPEFGRAQAELNDALMELKGVQRRQVEEWARAFDLPTRAELNTLLKRVNTLRRRLREVEEELEALRGRKRP